MKILTIENLKKKERNGKWVVLMWQPQAEKTVSSRLEISSLVSWQFLGIFWLSHVFVKFPLFICHRGLYWIVLPWPTFVCNNYFFSRKVSNCSLFSNKLLYHQHTLYRGVAVNNHRYQCGQTSRFDPKFMRWGDSSPCFPDSTACATEPYVENEACNYAWGNIKSKPSQRCLLNDHESNM